MLHLSHRDHSQATLWFDTVPRILAGCMVALFLVISISCGPTDLGSTSTNGSAKRLTLERLYSLPSLIGTAPSGFAWSRDSSRVAFLWNDDGRPHRDVWVVEAGASDASPTRWSDLQRTSPNDSTVPADKLVEAALPTGSCRRSARPSSRGNRGAVAPGW